MLTHYAVSYLVCSRRLSYKTAALISLAGLLPDVDAVFGIHRWVTHSIVLTAPAMAAILLAIYRLERGYITHATLACVVYILHLAMDVFTAPTPLLWPLIPQAYCINLCIAGAVAGLKVWIWPELGVTVENAAFTKTEVVYGVVVSSMGVIVAATVIAAMAVEKLARKQKS